MWDGNSKRQVWLWLFKAMMSFIMISKTSNFKRVLKHAMTKLIPKWKCATILVKQTVNYWSWNPLPLLLSKYKRNCAQRNTRIASKVKLKPNYINSYFDPSPLVSLWLSEVIVNNLSNLISNLQKNKLTSNYTLIVQSLTISFAMAFGGNW